MLKHNQSFPYNKKCTKYNLDGEPELFNVFSDEIKTHQDMAIRNDDVITHQIFSKSITGININIDSKCDVVNVNNMYVEEYSNRQNNPFELIPEDKILISKK